MRVGFLFNHYAVHQVPHAVPYAFELSRKYPDLDVVIACSSKQEMRTARAIGMLYPSHRCRFELLNPAWWYYHRLVDLIVPDSKFKRKKNVLRNNLDFFRTLDALVAPEQYCTRLRTEYWIDRSKLIRNTRAVSRMPLPLMAMSITWRRISGARPRSWYCRRKIRRVHCSF